MVLIQAQRIVEKRNEMRGYAWLQTAFDSEEQDPREYIVTDYELAVQDVWDKDQKTRNEKDREKKPLPQRLVLQFAAIRGRARLRTQRYCGERWGRGANPTFHARAK
jgi:hypothetical protein